MNRKAELLRALLVPHLVLEPTEMELLLPHLREVRYRAGQRLFEQGEVCHEAVLLGRGLVRAYYVHESHEVNLRLLCAPAVATAMSSLITGAPSTEWVEAISDVNGYRADLRALEHAGQQLLVQTLRRLLAEQHYLSLERRLHMLQSKSVAEKFAFFCREMPPDIVEQTPGYHVASYLAVTPETLSRVRRKATSG